MVDDNNFSTTIQQAFDLPEDEDYKYQSEGFAMALGQIQSIMDTGTRKWHYRGPDGGNTPISPSDIDAYIAIFRPETDTANTLKSFLANARKDSPRSRIASYLVSKRIYPDSTASDVDLKLSKRKARWPNPAFDVWAYSCHETGFVGPLDDPHYANPLAAKQTHPMLPVMYHHFGCVVPTWEGLNIIERFARDKEQGVVDMGSGNGYWTYMLRRVGVKTIPVDNGGSNYRYNWVEDTVQSNGVDFLRQNAGWKEGLLLLVYMVTRGDFNRKVLKAYKGDTVIVVGTQNANRFTGFEDRTVEEFFETEMKGWTLRVRVAVPSFAGKDEGLFVWTKGR